MKFERQRGSQGLNNKVEINNQQFLTFRNAQPNQNTGRSVYSQQFDYRSLQKCFKEEEEDVPIYNFRKNLKNVRSQDKFKLVQQEFASDLIGDQNVQSNTILQQQRSEQLNKKLDSLIKNIKKAKKKEVYFQQQISNIEIIVKQNNEQISKNKADIQQLQDILQQNQNSYDQMVLKLQDFKERAQILTQKIAFAQESLENEQNITQSSGQYVVQLPKKLQQGIKELQRMRDQFQKKITFFQTQINFLEQKLGNLELINNEIRNVV